MATQLPPSPNKPAKRGHPLPVVQVEYELKKPKEGNVNVRIKWKSAKWECHGDFPLDNYAKEEFLRVVEMIHANGYASTVAKKRGNAHIPTLETCGGFWNFYCNKWHRASGSFVAVFTCMGVIGGDFKLKTAAKVLDRNGSRKPARRENSSEVRSSEQQPADQA